MRLLLSSLACVVLLSACGSGHTLSPEQKAQRAVTIAKTNAALKAAKTVDVAGKAFSVATIADRNYALVALQGAATPYTVADVERASALVTGCKGMFSAGVLAFLSGDINTIDLNDLRSKNRGTFNGWRVDLKC